MKNRNWIDLILGDPDQFKLRSRVLNAILFCSLLTAALLELNNLFFALKPGAHYLIAGGTISSVALYVYNRKRADASSIVAWLWLFSMVVLLFAEWGIAYESKRVGATIAVAVMIFVPAVIRGWKGVLGVFLIVGTLLIILIGDFRNDHLRPFVQASSTLGDIILLDRYISAICLGMGGAGIMYLVIESYARQTRKIERLNTELDRLHQDALRDNMTLSELNQMKNSIFSIIAHDLKNPIGGISSVSSTLASEGELFSEPEKKELLDMMSESSQSAFELLNDLLTWARSESGIMERAPGSIYVRECLAESSQLMRVLLEEKSIEFINSCDPEHEVWADMEMAQVICRNLLSNAIKFTPDGGFIRVQSAEVGDFIEVTIQDSGVGMSEQEIEGIFSGKPMRSKAGTRNESGSGLGLRLVKEFVVRSNGTIRAESREGEGTRFILKMPAAQVQGK